MCCIPIALLKAKIVMEILCRYIELLDFAGCYVYAIADTDVCSETLSLHPMNSPSLLNLNVYPTNVQGVWQMVFVTGRYIQYMNVN